MFCLVYFVKEIRDIDNHTYTQRRSFSMNICIIIFYEQMIIDSSSYIVRIVSKEMMHVNYNDHNRLFNHV